MWVQPVLLEDVQVQQRIPRRGRLGKRVGLAGERIQAIAAHAVTTLDLHEGWLLDGRADGRPPLHPPQAAALIAVLDRLCQAHPVLQPHAPSAPSPLARGGPPDRRGRAAWPGAVLRRPKDQDSWASGVERCRSCTSTGVSAWAWRGAGCSQWLIVSSVWPPPPSAAGRLPRRMTSSR